MLNLAEWQPALHLYGTYSLLATAVLLHLWRPSWVYTTLALSLAAVVLSFFSGALSVAGAITLLGFSALCSLAFNLPTKSMLRFMALGATMVGGCALIQHQLPGMEGWLFWDQVRVSSASKPYTMYFPLDKVLMGLILAVCSGRLMMERHQTPFVEWGTVFRVGGLCIVSLMGVSLASGHVIFDPKWTILAGVWAVNNLLFQCFAEEMLYRGLIQQTLVDYAKRFRVSSFWPVLLSALIFGLSHYRGGLPFMVLSAVAGGFYGYVYLKTHRLDVAIGLHFALNFIHFVLFTYPSALRL